MCLPLWAVHLLLGVAGVVRGAAVGAVLALATIEEVLALGAVELVVADVAFEAVGSRAADEHVRVLRAVDQLQRAERVGSRAARGRAPGEAHVHPGRRVVVVEPVPAGTAVDLVVAGASTEVVGTAETG